MSMSTPTNHNRTPSQNGNEAPEELDLTEGLVSPRKDLSDLGATENDIDDTEPSLEELSSMFSGVTDIDESAFEWEDVSEAELEMLRFDSAYVDELIREQTPQGQPEDINEIVWAQVSNRINSIPAETTPTPTAAEISPILTPEVLAERKVAELKSRPALRALLVLIIALAGFSLGMVVAYLVIKTDPSGSLTVTMLVLIGLALVLAFKDQIGEQLSIKNPLKQAKVGRDASSTYSVAKTTVRGVAQVAFKPANMYVYLISVVVVAVVFFFSLVPKLSSMGTPSFTYAMLVPTAPASVWVASSIIAQSTHVPPATLTAVPAVTPIYSDTGRVISITQNQHGDSLEVGRSKNSLKLTVVPTETNPASDIGDGVVIATPEPIATNAVETPAPGIMAPTAVPSVSPSATPQLTSASEIISAVLPTRTPQKPVVTAVPPTATIPAPTATAIAIEPTRILEVATFPAPIATATVVMPKPTPTPTATATASPVIEAPHRCPAGESEASYTILFNNVAPPEKGRFIRSDKDWEKAKQTQSVSIEPGTYRVRLSSYDNHQLPSDEQPHESWYVAFDDGSQIVESNAIQDLPTELMFLTQTVNDALELNSVIVSVSAVHDAYPDTNNPNSVVPVCAVLDLVE